MSQDKRISREQPTEQELLDQLTPVQRLMLPEIELMGWTLKFVRKPLFQDPVPVVYCKDKNEIGTLDADGRINVEGTYEVRDEDDLAAEAAEVEQTWREKRCGADAIPQDLSKYLNDAQLNSLEHMGGFGWTLKYVRRPLFQDPVVIICSPNSERHAVLDDEGNIEIGTELVIREVEAADEPKTGS